jgi:hypothetical protein
VTLGSSTTVTDSSGTSRTVGQNEVFVFKNGVQIGGTVTIYGTLAVTGTGDFLQGNNALNIAAPANEGYEYNGIAMDVTSTGVSCHNSINSFKGTPAPGGCLQIQFGSGSFGTSSLDGMIYAPLAQVYMQDNGGGSVVTALIADEIYDKSSSLQITNNYNYVHTTSPLNHVSLVE